MKAAGHSFPHKGKSLLLCCVLCWYTRILNQMSIINVSLVYFQFMMGVIGYDSVLLEKYLCLSCIYSSSYMTSIWKGLNMSNLILRNFFRYIRVTATKTHKYFYQSFLLQNLMFTFKFNLFWQKSILSYCHIISCNNLIFTCNFYYY